MLLLGALGVDPWDVFHQGLSRRFGLGVGTWALIVSAGVLLLWIPLRQRPGLGTVSNAIVVGRDVVLNTGCPHLEADLRSAGFSPHSTELGEFIKAGGSAKCLSATRPPRTIMLGVRSRADL